MWTPRGCHTVLTPLACCIPRSLGSSRRRTPASFAQLDCRAIATHVGEAYTPTHATDQVCNLNPWRRCVRACEHACLSE